jgi:hypothetical protein
MSSIKDEEITEEDYDKSLEYRQITRWVILAGLILFIAAIFIYVLFFVD